MSVFGVFLIVVALFVASVESGVLIDRVSGIGDRILGRDTATTQRAPTFVRKPLHSLSTNYLEDDVVEDQTAAPGSRVEKLDVTATMQQVDNGVYEFAMNDGRCRFKFFTDKRQTQRSLMCNAKQCLTKGENKWTCPESNLSCAIQETANKATCSTTRVRDIIKAPSRNPCPAGQRPENGLCRSPF